MAEPELVQVTGGSGYIGRAVAKRLSTIIAWPLSSCSPPPGRSLLTAGAAARLTTAKSGLLNCRARHVAVRTEHAAVAIQRSQERAAMPAIVEILASVGWHRLLRHAAAPGTGQPGDQLGHAPPSSLISGCSR